MKGAWPGGAGVIQMNAGIMNSLFNQRYFRDNLSTWRARAPRLDCTNTHLLHGIQTGALAYQMRLKSMRETYPEQAGPRCRQSSRGARAGNNPRLPAPCYM